jgi:uncharacterized RDD family membrane protein YckC
VNVVNQKIGRLAAPVKRLIAIVLDLLIPMLALGTMGIVSQTSSGEANVAAGLFSILAIVYLVWAFILFTRGTTPGKKILGMRVVKEDGLTADFFTMFIRETVGRLISSLGFFLGFLWILIDKDNQGWHDKLMRTYVVESVK